MTVRPLSDEARPSGPCPADCPNSVDGHCEDHKKMESSRALGMAFFKFAGWSVPIGIMVLVGILSVVNARVDSVEGKIVGSNSKLDAIHHSVMNIEYNLRNDLERRDEKYIELKYKEEY